MGKTLRSELPEVASAGCDKRSKELAIAIGSLKDNDQNIKSVTFIRYEAPGNIFGGNLTNYCVTAHVKLDKSFSEVDEFQKYLKANNFSSGNKNVVISSENPLNVIFQEGSFSASFYESYVANN